MIKSVVVALLMVIAGMRTYSYDPYCHVLPSNSQVITHENVRRVCGWAGFPGRVIESRWHKTEPVLVLLVLPQPRSERSVG